MTPNRILVVCPNWVGDVLFATPALRALRKAYPNSFIACLLPARVREVLDSSPYVNETLLYNDRATFFSVGELAGVIVRLKRRNFDTALFFHRSKTKAWLAKAAGIPHRIGYESPGRAPLLTQRVSVLEGTPHKIDQYLHLAEKLGAVGAGRHMDFFPAPGAEEEIGRLLKARGLSPDDPYVVIHAGGNWELKRWPVPYFVKTIRFYLASMGVRVVLCGTEADRGACEDIRSHFTEKEVISLCGKTSLSMLGVLLKRARLLLSNDSGPIHLAASQGTRLVGLFGPTSPQWTGPASLSPMKLLWKDVGCTVPCYFRHCDHRSCMDHLSVQEVCDSSKELLHA